MKTKLVLYTAAHGGFDLSRVPLGGAAAICDLLSREWQKQTSFTLRILAPDILGKHAPHDKDLVRYSEMRYARFCFEFEQATTAEILKQDPQNVVVLINDISEGPDFRRLAEKGYTFYTIYHVDVVDYVSRLYFHGWIRSETLTALYAWVERTPLKHILPDVLKLVYAKQRDSLFFSRGVIVPSEGMKRVLLRCYPGTQPEKIHILPWGVPEVFVDEAAVRQKKEELRQHYGIPEGARVIITLSRISPEKGQDRLLKALKLWEKRGDLPAGGLWVLICGEAAYMQGVRFRRRLEKLAQPLKKIHVIFPGYLSGVDKQAHFALADLYIFPSVHESYGLTLLEAYRAGLPAIACHHYGAEELLRPEFGELLPPVKESEIPGLLQSALKRLLADPVRLKEMGKKVRAFAEARPFSKTAETLAKIITENDQR